MVSGFLTSPLDQDRMASGDATPMATCSTWLTFSKPSSSRALSLVLIIRSENGLINYANNEELNRGQDLDGFAGLVHRVGITHLHIESQRLHFLNEHVER